MGKKEPAELPIWRRPSAKAASIEVTAPIGRRQGEPPGDRPGRKGAAGRGSRLGGASPLSIGLGAAAAALLSPSASDAGSTQFETGLVGYSEFDRVSLLEGVINLRRELRPDHFLEARLVVDVLTGASPNGATPADTVQTFTRPSGRGSFQVEAGDTPLDDVFQDNRGALDVDLEFPLDRVTRASVGGHASVEYDYQSWAARAAVTRDLGQRNTTLALSASYAWDHLFPEGNAPVPLASMGRVGRTQPRQPGTEHKETLDVLCGITQVLGRATLGHLGYSFSRSWGYHNDPFKLITVVEGSGPDPGQPVDYLFESRPGLRTKQALVGEIKRHLQNDVVEVSYRYFWDNWGLISHTGDVRYWWRLSRGRSWKPHLRYYHQSAVAFYRHSLIDGDRLPAQVTADSRQARFNAITVGTAYLFPRDEDHDLSLGVEYYLQLHEGSPPDAIGAQTEMDLVPNVGAIILRIGTSFDF